MSQWRVYNVDELTGVSISYEVLMQTSVLGSKFHEALLEAMKLALDTPSPKYNSTETLNKGRVVRREDRVTSMLPAG